MDEAARAKPAGSCVHYQRRRPEHTTLYQLVQEHAETFFAQVECETGAGLPDFVKAEFDAFLDCGILANGRFSQTKYPLKDSPSWVKNTRLLIFHRIETTSEFLTEDQRIGVSLSGIGDAAYLDAIRSQNFSGDVLNSMSSSRIFLTKFLHSALAPASPYLLHPCSRDPKY